MGESLAWKVHMATWTHHTFPLPSSQWSDFYSFGIIIFELIIHPMLILQRICRHDKMLITKCEFCDMKATQYNVNILSYGFFLWLINVSLNSPVLLSITLQMSYNSLFDLLIMSNFVDPPINVSLSYSKMLIYFFRVTKCKYPFLRILLLCSNHFFYFLFFPYMFFYNNAWFLIITRLCILFI